MAMISDRKMLSQLQKELYNTNVQYQVSDMKVDTDPEVVEFLANWSAKLEMIMDLFHSIQSLTMDEHGNIAFWFTLSVANKDDFLFPVWFLQGQHYNREVLDMFNIYTSVAVQSAIINGLHINDLFEHGCIEFEKMIQINEIDHRAEQAFYDELTAWRFSN